MTGDRTGTVKARECTVAHPGTLNPQNPDETPGAPPTTPMGREAENPGRVEFTARRVTGYGNEL